MEINPYNPYSTAIGPPLKMAMTMVPPVAAQALRNKSVNPRFNCTDADGSAEIYALCDNEAEAGQTEQAEVSLQLLFVAQNSLNLDGIDVGTAVGAGRRRRSSHVGKGRGTEGIQMRLFYHLREGQSIFTLSLSLSLSLLLPLPGAGEKSEKCKIGGCRKVKKRRKKPDGTWKGQGGG